jgi:hypothetical protein
MPKATMGFANEPQPGLTERTAFPYDTIKTDKCEIRDCPCKLPIGIFHDGQRLIDYTCKPYTGEEELQLSALSKRFQKKAGDVLPGFLAGMIETIGGTPIKELASSKSLSVQRVCEQMFLADALTMLLQIRLDSYGERIQLAGQCPNCGNHNKDREGEYSELDTVELVVVKELPYPTIELTLEDGFTSFEETIKRVHLRPARVYDLKRMTKQKDEADFEFIHELMLNTVVAIPDSTAWGTSSNSDRTGISSGSVEEIFKLMTPNDRELLKEAVGELANFGPAMTSPMTCRNCRFEYQALVPWNDLPSFLSRPTRKRNR